MPSSGAPAVPRDRGRGRRFRAFLSVHRRPDARRPPTPGEAHASPHRPTPSGGPRSRGAHRPIAPSAPLSVQPGVSRRSKRAGHRQGGRASTSWLTAQGTTVGFWRPFTRFASSPESVFASAVRLATNSWSGPLYKSSTFESSVGTPHYGSRRREEKKSANIWGIPNVGGELGAGSWRIDDEGLVS